MSTPPPTRRGRPGHDRAAVLRAAVALFIAKGYDATSIDDVARSLGVTKSAVYHHVASKQELLGAALDEALAELELAVGTATSGTGPAHQRLRWVLGRSTEVLVERQSAVTLLLRVRGNSEVERVALERRRAIDHALAGLVRQAVDEGALRDDLDPEVVSRLLFGMVNSLVEWYRADGSVAPDQLVRSVTAMAFDGLTAAR